MTEMKNGKLKEKLIHLKVLVIVVVVEQKTFPNFNFLFFPFNFIRFNK